MRRVELRHVSKRFGKVKAVDDLSLVVEPGAFLTLLGPSGCRKTTVLRRMAGLEELDSGDILIDSRAIFSRAQYIFVPPAQRGIGMVFQSYAPWPHMTAYQNVALGLGLRTGRRTALIGTTPRYWISGSPTRGKKRHS